MNNTTKLAEVIKEKNDLATFETLQLKICETIDASKSGRDIAALSRQLLMVSEKIAELEAQTKKDDIDSILEMRAAAGKPGAVRNERRQAVAGELFTI